MKTRQLQYSSKPYKPHDYQKKAIKFLLANGAAALFLDPGLGKTSITLAAFSVLLKEKVSKGMLVIAPLRVCYLVWPAEVEKWRDFEHISVGILHGANKQKVLAENHDIYVINPEGLSWLTQAPNMKTLKQKGVDTLCIDELSKFKHSNTVRFKSMRKNLPQFRRRWGLTGSPASNGLMGLFGQCYMLDMGKALGQYVTHYRNKYFDNTGYGGYTYILKPGAQEEIEDAIRPLVLRMAGADYLELPQLIHNVIYVDLPPEARQYYEQMEHDAFIEIEEQGVVTAANAAGAMSKCSQIANGGVYNGQDAGAARGVTELHTAKVEALIDLVEELQGAPLLVAYEFKHDVDRIQKAMGAVPCMGGNKDAKYAAAWNNDELPVLLGHPQSIGHGLNLQGKTAHNVCWFGLTFNYELYDQFIRRVLRQGNKSQRVIVHHIIARSTYDEVKYAALQRKEGGQSAFLEAFNTYRRAKK